MKRIRRFKEKWIVKRKLIKEKWVVASHCSKQQMNSKAKKKHQKERKSSVVRFMKPKVEEVKKRKAKGEGRPKPEPGPPFRVTVKDMCSILSMKEYPMIITSKTKEFFKTYEEFEQFYLPRMVTINSYHECILKTFCKAKYNEILDFPEELN